MAKPEYTNSYVCGVALNGEGDLDVMMFTHDPTFKPNGPRAAEVQKWCDDFGVDRNCIYYVKPKKDTKKYNAESSEQYVQYHRKYKRVFKDATVCHDGGPALKIKGQYVFEEGLREVIPFPSIQHGCMSVCDNHLFGTAKTTWRAERSNTDFSMDAVKLIQCINWPGADAINNMWRANFLLDEQPLTLKAVESWLDRGPKTAWAHADARMRYEAVYANFLIQNDDKYGVEVDSNLESQLDGSYWNE